MDMHETVESPPRVRGVRRMLGYVLVGAGLLLLLASGAYYGYGHWAKSTFDDLSFDSARPVAWASVRDDAAGPSGAGSDSAIAPVSGVMDASDAPQPVAVSDAVERTDPPPDRPTPSPASRTTAAATAGTSEADRSLGSAPPAAAMRDEGGPSDGSSAPGAAIRPAVSAVRVGADALEEPAVDEPALDAPVVDEPAIAPAPVTEALQPQEPAPAAQVSALDFGGDAPASRVGDGDAALSYLASDLPEGEWRGFAAPTSALLPAAVPPSRIVIPAIGVDSDVKKLRLLLKDTGYEWETPKWVVGHVPTSGNPGMQRQGWYLGHLESPLRGEGNVFKRLPDIPPLLKEGETVHIVVEADGRRYLYQVYKSALMHEDDLKITYSREQDITLVTCYPSFVYDHRLLVTAALVGVSES